jgi:hypothetical protein
MTGLLSILSAVCREFAKTGLNLEAAIPAVAAAAVPRKRDDLLLYFSYYLL